MNMEPRCAVCNKNAPHKCSACLSISYCSAEHQRQHWKMHRNDCTSFRIVDDAKLGKGMIATRGMKAGTLVLQEKPVVVSAFWEASLGNESLTTACLTCGLALNVGQHVRKCSKCKWPICSLGCEKLGIHSENECELFVAEGFSYPPPLPTDRIGDLVKGLRACLLKRKDPQLYQQIFELSSEYCLPGDEEFDLVGDMLMKLLSNVENLKLEREEVGKLMKTFAINCHSSVYVDKKSRKSKMQRRQATEGLYLNSSRFNHSCAPNCHWKLSSKPEFKIRVCTSIPVKKGDPLTVAYWTEDSVYATRGRQELIRSKGRFICECARCLDPTELGTYMSGITCKVCSDEGSNPSGYYYLPEDPLDLSDTSTWKCNGCGDVKTSAAILPVVEDIEGMVDNMEFEHGDDPLDNALLEFCQSVVRTNSGKVLHPNHWVIQKAMRAVCNHLQQHHREAMGPESEWIQYYVQCSKHLLSIQELVSPGMTLIGVNLHEGIASALELQCSALLAQGNYGEAEKNFEACFTHLQEALAYWKTGFPSIEGSDTLEAMTERRILSVLMDLNDTRLKRMEIRGNY